MVYKDIKFHNFHEVDNAGWILRVYNGSIIYSKKKDGVRIVLDRKQDHSHLKTNNIEGDLVVLDTVAFVTNTRDQVVEPDSITINASVYPNFCRRIYKVYNTRSLNSAPRLELDTEEYLLSTEDSKYTLRANKDIADSFLLESSTRTSVYSESPKFTLIDFSCGFFRFDGKFHVLSKNMLNRNSDMLYLKEEEYSLFENWKLRQEIIDEKIIDKKTDKTGNMIPKKSLKEFLSENGYDEEDDYEPGGGFNNAMSEMLRKRDPLRKITIPETKGVARCKNEYKKYLEEQENWIPETRTRILKEVTIKYTYDKLPLVFIIRKTYLNEDVIKNEVIKRDCDLNKVNSVLAEIYKNETLIEI